MMRRHVVAASVAAILVATAACTAEQVIAPDNASHVVVRTKALASTAALVVEISGPGIDPALLFNMPVGPDTVAQDTLSVPSGGARRFVVTAVDTLGAPTHRADTTMRLLPGLQPSVSFVLAPIPLSEDSIAFASGTLVAGERHTCGLTEEGAAYCWGSNDFGQLGDGTTQDRGAPTAVGGEHVFVYLSAGLRHSCGLLETGVAYCWGENAAGQLGTGTTQETLTPAPVSGGLLFRQISAGWQATCGLTSSGKAHCWGGGVLRPRPVVGGRSYNVMAVGRGFACALEHSNAAYCWGNGNDLGDVAVATPVLVSGGLAFTALAVGGRNACGVTTAGWRGHVYCWTSEAGSSPSPAATQGSFRTVSMFGGHACALSQAGTAYCWGANSSGQLGDGTFVTRSTPKPLGESSTFVSIAAGGSHSCALTGDGSARCWGFAYYGRLGDDTMWGVQPRELPGGEHVTNISVSSLEHSCAVYSGGQARCWGRNFWGMLGTGTLASSSTPVPVVGALQFDRVVIGWNHSCGLTGNGAAYCWGIGRNLGAGDSLLLVDSVPAPVPVSLSAPLSGLAVGVNHTCALDQLGAAWCWGSNSQSRSGVVTTQTYLLQPTKVSGGFAFASLALGNVHSCGLTSDGIAYCWGGNQYGARGVSDAALGGSLALPVAVTGDLRFTQLVAGEWYTCGLAVDGIVYCWGWNSRGQLGDGTNVSRFTPAPVSGGIRFSRLSTGPSGNHTCGIAESGTTYCWGANDAGNLGDGTRLDRSVPVAVLGGLSFKEIVVGRIRTCAIALNDRAYCWGAETGEAGVASGRPVVGGLTFRTR